jgi:hypothetical protein
MFPTEQYVVLVLRKLQKFGTTNIVIFFFYNSHSGEWSPNWVYTTHQPLIGLLYLSRMIVRMENLVE